MAGNQSAQEKVEAHYLFWEKYLSTFSDMIVEVKAARHQQNHLKYQVRRLEEARAMNYELELEWITKQPNRMLESQNTWCMDLFQEYWGAGPMPNQSVPNKENLEQPTAEKLQEISRDLKVDIEEFHEKTMETEWVDKVQLSSDFMNRPVVVYTSNFEAEIPDLTLDQSKCIEEHLNLIEVKEVVHEPPECILIEEFSKGLNFDDIYDVNYARILVDVQESEEQNLVQQVGKKMDWLDKVNVGWNLEFEAFLQ